MFEKDFEDMLHRCKDIIEDKKRFTALVKDLFPDQSRNVNLLLMAYNMGIATDMATVARINNTFAYRYVKRLVDDYGMSRINADWIVSVWCVCFGEKVLGKPCDIAMQKEGDGKPAIDTDTTLNAGKQYGDLFTYSNSVSGDGLCVTGFNGDNPRTIIFQNRYRNNSVVEIGDNAFADKDIEEVIITEGITIIGKCSFAGNKRLHQVVFPISIKEIGDEAFSGCEGLKTASLPMLLEKLEDRAFAGTGLKTISIPETIYWLGEEVFAHCTAIDNVKIPENITEINNGMFNGCTALKKIILHEKLQKIGDKAFFECSSLDFIIIPDSVTFIGKNAFDGVDKQFIIQCSFGSYAEEYARKSKIKYQLV